MERLLPTQTGRPRMETLDQLARACFTQPQEEHYTRMWIEEAHRQRDHEAEGKARVRLVNYYKNAEQPDSMTTVLRESEPFWRRHKQYYAMFLGLGMEVGYLIEHGDYELAIDRARKVYDEAREMESEEGQITALENIGTAYIYSERYKEAIPSLEEAMTMLKQTDRTYWTVDIYAYLTIATAGAEQWEESLGWALEAIRFFDAIPQTVDKALPMEDSYVFEHSYAAQSLTELGRLDEAKEHLDKAREYALTPMEDTYLRAMAHAEAQYYQSVGEYVLALESIDRSLATAPVTERKSKLVLKSSILEAMGRSSEANAVYREQIALADSLTTAAIHSQVTQLHTIYRLDKAEAKAAHVRIYLYFSLGVIALGLIILSGYIFYTRRLRQKNRSLYRQIVDQENMRKGLAQARALLGQNSQSNATEKGDGLFGKAERLMRSAQLYTDPALTRKSLAERLGTNENYLATAIREGTGGQSLSEYFNTLRLNDALDRLLTSSEPIERIAEEVGFSSYRYFHRLFRERFGLSPSALRRQSQQQA